MGRVAVQKKEDQPTGIMGLTLLIPLILIAVIVLTCRSSLAQSIAGDAYLHPAKTGTGSLRESLPCGSKDGWVSASSDNRPDSNVLGSATEKRGTAPVLQWNLIRKRGSFNALVRPTSLTHFRSMEFDIASQVATLVVVPVDDLDGAKFNSIIKLEAGQWHHVRLTPSDFRISDDSPVKKQSLDPSRAVMNFSLADLGGILGHEGPNVIQLSNVVIERAGIPVVQLPPIIDGRTIIIAENCRTRGDVLIRNHGCLRITAPGITIGSNIKIENDSSFEVVRSIFSFYNRYPHDLTITARNKSTVSIKQCASTNDLPVNLDLVEGSRLILADTNFTGAGFTCGAPPGNSISLSRVKAPGEFIVMPGSKVTITDCQSVLLWPWFMAPYKVDLKLPDGKFIANWTMPASTGLDLSLSNCRDLLWGMILDKGADVSLQDSNIRAIGLTLKGTNHSLQNIRNKAAITSLNLKLGDRSLKLNGGAVNTWNFYPGEKSKVDIRDCLFGEVMTFDDSHTEITNSQCDGTGGYIAAKGRSKLTLSGCTLNCHVATVDGASLILQKCRVNGSLSASGTSTIELNDSVVTGSLIELDKAKIIRRH